MAEQLDIASSFSSEIQWSYNGDKILIYAKGDTLHPCPSHLDTAQDMGKMYHVPCWMVINSKTGEIVWTLSQLSIDPNYSGDFIQKYFFTHAAISPDGKYLALDAAYFGIYSIELVEISSGNILFGLDARIDGIRWKNY